MPGGRRERGHRRVFSGFRTPDAVAHVRVGCVVDSGLCEIAQILFVFLNLLLTARKVQRHLRHVMHIRVADVCHLQPGCFDAMLEAGEHLKRSAGSGDTDVLNTHLRSKREILIHKICGDLQGDLDPGRERIEGSPGGSRAGGTRRAPQQNAREFPTIVAGIHDEWFLNRRFYINRGAPPPGTHFPVQHGTRLSRNAEMPSCASAAMAFIDITSFA